MMRVGSISAVKEIRPQWQDPSICMANSQSKEREAKLPRSHGLGICTTRSRLLHGRTLNRPVRAENATIARLWPKARMTTRALMEEEAGVGGHDLDRRKTASRAGEDGLDDWIGHLKPNKRKLSEWRTRQRVLAKRSVVREVRHRRSVRLPPFPP